jgi:hypothetical protein
MDTAIGIARRKAGISEDEKIKIVEYPTPDLFDLGGLFGNPLFDMSEPIPRASLVDLIKFRLEKNGKPLPMLPLEDSYMFLEEIQ